MFPSHDRGGISQVIAGQIGRYGLPGRLHTPPQAPLSSVIAAGQSGRNIGAQTLSNERIASKQLAQSKYEFNASLAEQKRASMADERLKAQEIAADIMLRNRLAGIAESKDLRELTEFGLKHDRSAWEKVLDIFQSTSKAMERRSKGVKTRGQRKHGRSKN